jgi:hypothetical protein
LTSFFDTCQDGQEKLIGRGEIIIADADERWFEGCCRWNRDFADKKEVDENTIVTEADYGIR